MVAHGNLCKHLCSNLGYLMHMCALLCQLRGLRRDDTPLAASILSSQILVSNFILQLKRTRLLGETAGSRTQAENTPDEPRASYCVRK